MQPDHRPEPLKLGSLSRSRSASTPSDLQFSKKSVLSPPLVVPSPAYVAASAAVQIVSAGAHDVDLEDEEGTESNQSVSVTPPSLSLLNGFLDHILFNILAVSKSTRLSAIRPAIAEVLKPRFAKEVIAAADDELSEYMSGEDDEEEEFGGNRESQDFDLVRSWKLTRLRCMVYTRLGDMEEDDEDEYIEREGLNDMDAAHQRFSTNLGNITPAAAIFLTSIIEYIGEQALLIAGETARSRLSSKPSSLRDGQVESRNGRDYQLVLEENDMEKLALNATLGRLWRTWRKRVRSPALARTLSRESMLRRGFYTPTSVNSRKSSVATIEEAQIREFTIPPPAEEQEKIDPASIALPMSEHDVREIEIPGLAANLEGEIQTMEARVAHKVRPRSLMVVSSVGGVPSQSSPSSASPRVRSAVELSFGSHNRGWSVPTPTNSSRPDRTPDERDNGEEFVTPSEEKPQLETMYENDEATAPTGPQDRASVQEKSMVKERRSVEPTVDAHPEEVNIDSGIRAKSRRMAEPVGQPTSWFDSASADAGRVEQEEVIEGQGTRERQNPSSSVQRPKRKSSREASLKTSRSTVVQETSESVVQNVVKERSSSMQGTNSLRESNAASTPPNVNPQEAKKYASQKREQKNTINVAAAKSDLKQVNGGTAPLSPTPELTEFPEVPKRPPPRRVSHSSESVTGLASASDESERSSRSRARSRTNPRTSSGSQHRYGRSSPAVGTPSERAGVQRIGGSSAQRESSRRRSESASRPATAGSATSTKLKGFMGRSQSSQGSSRLRSASQTSRSSEKAGGLVDDDRSELDQLIDSEETIHYTLTPRNMRKMDAPDTRQLDAPRSSTLELAEFLKNTAPPGEDPTRPSMRGVNGLRANPPERPVTSKYKPIEIPTAASASSKAPISKNVQVRDARSTVQSTRDFADFLRSTGPPGQPAKPHSDMESRTRTSLSQQRPSTQSSRKTGPRLQARPATASKEEQTSDLIDFIREGPPTAGARRIPKTVAPFRNTMDSDELMSLGPRADNTAASSVGSTRNSSVNAAYYSDNSRTGLMESANRANVRTSPAVQQPSSFKGKPSGFPSEDDDMRPVRKQRRVRDPYAIDSEDEDDLEELMETPKPKPQREEESLLDFLRSEPPPDFGASTAPPQPFIMNAAPPKSSSGMSAASAMKARLLRNASLDRFPTAKQSKASMRSRRPTTGAVEPGHDVAAPASSYVQQAPSSPGTFSRSTPGQTDATDIDRDAIAPMPRRQTETSALADFLKNTGPPEPPAYRQSPTLDDEKSSSFTKLFSRRKKIEV
ncbi:conserved hypothetical protein [Paecilomyces variotii No. 5]|uniref:Flo11 n=1 Tax=Byssochlamys spectabilis (strain No. 5 / NBRC 109023) TaxID=1356009 RepID=V5GFJ2_BYSSN|nr:conserved hypothetical protein [Paecilomyces variotii No. 5]